MNHYIPVKRDLSNLVEQINWAKNHDNLVQKISKQAQMFANEHLTSDRILCYHVTLLKVIAISSNKHKSNFVYGKIGIRFVFSHFRNGAKD